MERELITEPQANLLMLAVLVIAPLVGLAWGMAARRVRRGITVGLLVGAGNYVLWTVYNVITDHLGLDTVKNLLVNLVLFSLIGVAIGLGTAWYNVRERKGKV